MMLVIWIAQMIIYPGFLVCKKKKLVRWHSVYTSRISYIVIPLMLIQLFVIAWLTFQHAHILNILSLMLVIWAFASTYLHVVPLHDKIADREATAEDLHALVHKNWYRTIPWTAVFLSGIIDLTV